MKLIKVEAEGFKSFADKISLSFDGGVVGIVGPNGSGKSNINDAIRWVLGEQSSKALRGDTMDDVIFSGSKTEKPMDKSVVTLTFDNSDGEVSIPHKIFTISRVLERGKGNNTYFINDQVVRFKDIRDIAYESGISKSSLAIISQGTVSDIAQATPEQRRGIIEDAAGTSKYKSKKVEALRKLEKTTETLDKVNTVVEELEKQLKPLEKQSEKAQIYIAKSNELKEVEVALLVNDLLHYKERVEILKNEIDGFQETKEDLEQKIQIDEQKLNDNLEYKKNLDEEVIELSKELDQINEKLQALEIQFKNEEMRREMIISGQISTASHERINALKKELESLSSQINHLESWKDKTSEELGIKRREIEKIEMQVAELRMRENSSKTKLMKAKSKLDVLNDYKDSKSNLFKGTKTVLDNGTLFKNKMFGTVADLISIPEKYILAMDSILQNAVQHIVVEDSETAVKIIEFLKDNNGGRATFIPLSSISSKEIKSEYLVKIRTHSGFIGIASDLVSIDPKFDVLVNFLLGNVIVVEDIKIANEISHLVDKKYLVVSLDGDLIRPGGIMTGGTKQNSNILGIENQIEQIKNIIPQLEEIVLLSSQDISKLESLKGERQSYIDQLTIEFVKNNEKLISIKEKFSSLKIDYESHSQEKFNESNIQSIDVELNNYRDKKSSLSATIKSKKDKLEQLTNVINQLQKSKKELEKSLRLIIESFSDKATEKTKADFYINDANKRLSEHYHLTFDSARENFKLTKSIEESRQIVSTLKTEISELGNVNLDAIQMYQEIKERHNDIYKDKVELEEAKRIINEAIAEMDKIIISRINNTMDIVNEEFNLVFKEMFGGGEARIFLLDPNDPLESGIDIKAQPPGKSIQNLKLFSGGEKSLIAISLLFAIIKAKPLPLCILDEVEAALDEANVVRFAEFLQKLKQDTQFIVITHRHGTMSRVDALFGATMQKRGVTSFFSIELAKAKELINSYNE